MNMILSIELVPQTCWFSNVRDHVSRDVWDTLRKDTYRAANYVCQICGGRGDQHPVECHEIWGYDDTKLTQTLIGLIALCPSCHEVKHIGLAGIRGRSGQAAKHLAKVNGWTAKQAQEYIRQAWEVWNERSLHNWTLDLSWLETKGVFVESHRGEVVKSK